MDQTGKLSFLDLAERLAPTGVKLEEVDFRRLVHTNTHAIRSAQRCDGPKKAYDDSSGRCHLDILQGDVPLDKKKFCKVRSVVESCACCTAQTSTHCAFKSQ